MGDDARSVMLGHPVVAGGVTEPDSLVRAVERRVLAHPDAVALVGGGDALTYEQLWTAAGECSRLLREAGVESGGVVPILMARSPRLVVTVLAVLRLGAAVSLMDPRWPEARVRDLLRELGAERVLVEGRPRDDDDLRVGLDGLWNGSLRSSQGVAAGTSCVMFTSGTTGQPKGVQVTHAGILRLFDGASLYRADRDTVMPLAAAVGWDAFHLELWSVLLTGGRLVVVDDDFLSTDRLRSLVRHHGVNSVFLTARLLDAIVEEDVDAFTGVGQVVSGGERMSPVHARRLLEAHPDLRLVNAYGPMEAGIVATSWVVRPADCERPGGIPIGRPAPDTMVHVRCGEREADPGEVGELWLSGRGLAAGYFRRDALTERSFVRLPGDAGVPGALAYRTGDLVRRDADGVVEFVGRADRQVKVRGHRIEPEELERLVERIAGVDRCAVVVRPLSEHGPARVLAFCVGTEVMPDVEGRLTEALPAHLVPDRVTWVDELPLTANGKVDESALVAGLLGALELSGAAANPGTTAGEQAVLEVVHEVVGRWIEPGTDFGAAGLGSLERLRTSARLGARLGRPVPVSRLYAHPTAAALATWLRGTAFDGGEQPAWVHADEAVDVSRLPLSDMQKSYLMTYLTRPEDRTAHCLGLWEVDGEVDSWRLQRAVDEVHARHDALTRSYVLDPDPVARLDGVPPPPVELLDDAPSVDDARRALVAELGAPLELESGDVWRVAVVRVPSADTTVLGHVVHHIAFDGASEAVLAADLACAYARPLDETPAPRVRAVGPGPAGRAEPADVEQLRRYWRQELTDAPPLVLPPGATRGHRPARLVRRLPRAVRADLDRTARELEVTLYALSLSTYARVLSAMTGQDDVVVGFPVSRREHDALSDVVGCHLGVLAVRLRGARIAGGADGIRATHQAVTSALAAQDLSWPAIVAAVNPPRSEHPPLCQNFFVLQDNEPPSLPDVGRGARYVREPYLGLPLPLQVELWPDGAGGLVVAVNHRPDDVDPAFAEELADRLVLSLTNLRAEVTP